MDKNVINPLTLKGKEQLQHIQELMNKLTPINETTRNSVVELTKKAADGKIYAIVRENHNYFIKIASQKKGPLVTEDFHYIGGLQNITDESYPTYAKALKRLNVKLIAIAENYGATGEINAFANEHLMGVTTEHQMTEELVDEVVEELEESDDKDSDDEEVEHDGKKYPKYYKSSDKDADFRKKNRIGIHVNDYDSNSDYKVKESIGSIAKALNEDDGGYCNYNILPKGIEEFFNSIEDIKKKK